MYIILYILNLISNNFVPLGRYRPCLFFSLHFLKSTVLHFVCFHKWLYIDRILGFLSIFLCKLGRKECYFAKKNILHNLLCCPSVFETLKLVVLHIFASLCMGVVCMCNCMAPRTSKTMIPKKIFCLSVSHLLFKI